MNELDVTAFHEAGHAVVAVVLGTRIERVVCNPDNPEGHVDFGPPYFHAESEVRDAASTAEARAVALSAGEEAERKRLLELHGPGFDGMAPTEASAHDQRVIRRIASALARDVLEEEEIKGSFRHRANELLVRHWAVVSAVADALLDRGQLTGEEVEEIVSPGPEPGRRP